MINIILVVLAGLSLLLLLFDICYHGLISSTIVVYLLFISILNLVNSIN